MKQVIIVAPHFPPSNLTAGHRCRYFAMHLPKFGWKVKVLSVAPSYYEEKLDYELEALIPPDLEVIRTRAFPTRPLRLIGDIGIRAFWWHYRMLCHLIKTEKIDLIYIPIPPNYSPLLGYLMHRKFGIPYAIDYIDPWVHLYPGCEIMLSKAWLSYHLARILEPLVLRHVSLITGVAPGYYEGALKRYPWLDAFRCIAMPYGAEEADFKYLDKNPRSTYLFNYSNGNIHIVYAGAMLPKAYSTLKALFQGLLVLKKRYPSLEKKLKFNFIGTGSIPTDPESFTVKPWAEQYNLLDIVSESPARIPYLDILNHLKHAHAVLILGSSEPHYTPSKVFQAVLSRRPVIALLHAKSTAVDILKEANAGIVVTFDESKPAGACVDEIAQTIYQAVNYDYSPEQVNWQAFRAYSTEAMTAKLARAFDIILSKKRPCKCKTQRFL